MQSSKPTCAYCSSDKAAYRCSACKTGYCSEQCQRYDWIENQHGRQCASKIGLEQSVQFTLEPDDWLIEFVVVSVNRDEDLSKKGRGFMLDNILGTSLFNPSISDLSKDVSPLFLKFVALLEDRNIYAQRLINIKPTQIQTLSVGSGFRRSDTPGRIEGFIIRTVNSSQDVQMNQDRPPQFDNSGTPIEDSVDLDAIRLNQCLKSDLVFSIRGEGQTKTDTTATCWLIRPKETVKFDVQKARVDLSVTVPRGRRTRSRPSSPTTSPREPIVVQKPPIKPRRMPPTPPIAGGRFVLPPRQ